MDALPSSPFPEHEAAIPLSEGTRLLMNRGKLLLDIKCRIARPESLTPDERQLFLKSLAKADLAFGDCALLLRGAYDLSYAVKRQRMPEISLSGLEDARAFVSAYSRALDFREQAESRKTGTVNVYLRFAETVRRYEHFFLWYERRRLNWKFPTLEKYAHTFPNLGAEGLPLKNALHNLRTFGISSLPFCSAHPRLRLYAAIPLLLTKHADREEIRWLLHARSTDYEELCQTFYELQQKFS